MENLPAEPLAFDETPKVIVEPADEDNIAEPTPEPTSAVSIFYDVDNTMSTVCAFLAESADPVAVKSGTVADYEPALDAFVIGGILSDEQLSRLASAHAHVRVWLGDDSPPTSAPKNVTFCSGPLTDHLLLINNPAVYTLIERVGKSRVEFQLALTGHAGVAALKLCSGGDSFEKVDRHFMRGEIIREIRTQDLYSQCETAPIFDLAGETHHPDDDPVSYRICVLPLTGIVARPDHPRIKSVTHLIFAEPKIVQLGSGSAPQLQLGWQFVVSGPNPLQLLGADGETFRSASATMAVGWLPVEDARKFLPHIYGAARG